MARTAERPAARRRAPLGLQFPIAYVKYYDHCWLQSKELEHIHDAGPYVVEETGFLLKDTPEYITLAKERSTDGEKGKTTFDDVTILMRSDIIDLQVFPIAPTPSPRGASRRSVPVEARRRKRTTPKKR